MPRARTDSLEQRVVFGLDPPEGDRWWGQVQRQDNWPGELPDSRRRPPRRCRCRCSPWLLLWVPLALCVLALSVYVALAPYWIVRDDATSGGRGSLGLFRRCLPAEPCRTFSADHLLPWRQLPGLWLTAVCVSALAALLATISAGCCVFSCCARRCGCLNIYKTAGTLYVLAVLCHVLAAVVYPVDWGAGVVRELCGDNAQAFVLGDCGIGWCVYALMLNTCLSLACAALAAKIDASTPEYVEYGSVKS